MTEELEGAVLGVDVAYGQDTSVEHVTMPRAEYEQLKDDLKVATDTVETLRIADDVHGQQNQLLRDENTELQAQLTAERENSWLMARSIGILTERAAAAETVLRLLGLERAEEGRMLHKVSRKATLKAEREYREQYPEPADRFLATQGV
jgi:hypothetical protein